MNSRHNYQTSCTENQRFIGDKEISADLNRKYLLVLELAKELEDTITGLQAENKHLRETVADLNTENGEIANDLMDMCADHEHLQKECVHLIHTNKVLQLEKEALQTKCDVLEENAENTLQAGEAEEAIMKIQYSAKQQMKQFSVEKEALQNELSKVSLEKENLLEAFHSLQKKLDKVQKGAAEKDSVIANLMKRAIPERSPQMELVNANSSPNSPLRSGTRRKPAGLQFLSSVAQKCIAETL